MLNILVISSDEIVITQMMQYHDFGHAYPNMNTLILPIHTKKIPFNYYLRCKRYFYQNDWVNNEFPFNNTISN